MKTKYIYIILGLLSFLLYANTLQNEFVWDDQLVITENKYTTQGINALKDIWTKDTYLPGRDIYRPIPQSIFAIEWNYFPNNPLVGHLTVLFFYVFLVLSLVYALKLFFPTLNNWLIFFIGLMFSLLPVHVEAVANIKSLDEILSAIFSIWTLITLRKVTLINIIVATLFFSLALLSKVSAITILPFIIFLLVDSLKIDFDKHLTKIKTVIDYQLIIVILLLLVAAYMHKNNAYGLMIYYPLYFALFFTLFIKNRIVKIASFLIITIGLSYYGRWEFSLLALIILFDQELNRGEINKLLWVGVFILFSAITIALDYNHISSSIAIALLLFVYYYYKVFNKERLRYLFYFILFSSVFFSLMELNNLRFKVFFIMSTILMISNKKYLLKDFSKALLLILFIPIIEMSFEFSNYQDVYNNFKHPIEKNIINNIAIDEITPYHNILVASENNVQKAATICRIQLIYLQKLIFPIHLVHQYGTRQIEFASWKDWDVYLSILIHLILIGGVYYFYKKRNFLVLSGIVWYFITISIYTNIIRLMPDTMAERFLLLPSIGFCIAFITGLSFFLDKATKNEIKTNRIMAIILAPLFIYYAYKTIDRNQDWKNNYTLAANTLPFAENNATINAQYALEVDNLIKNNQIQNIDSAESLVVKHYQKAIDIFPDFYAPNADLAIHFIKKAEPNNAFPYLLSATRIKPDEWIYQYYLGLIYYERKKYNEAIERFNKVESNKYTNKDPFSNPELLDAYEYEARCLHNLGKDSLAVIELEKAIDIFNQKSTYVLLANIYRTSGKTDKAIETFEKLLTYTPDDQELINTIQFLKEGKIY